MYLSLKLDESEDGEEQIAVEDLRQKRRCKPPSFLIFTPNNTPFPTIVLLTEYSFFSPIISSSHPL